MHAGSADLQIGRSQVRVVRVRDRDRVKVRVRVRVAGALVRVDRAHELLGVPTVTAARRGGHVPDSTIAAWEKLRLLTTDYGLLTPTTCCLQFTAHHLLLTAYHVLLTADLASAASACTQFQAVYVSRKRASLRARCSHLCLTT